MNNTNKQRGAMSTGAVVGIVVVILIIIGLAYWYSTGNMGGAAPTDTASTTTDGTGNNNTGASGSGQTSSVIPNNSGSQTYSNFKYGFSIDFPKDVQNNISNSEGITFSYDNGTTTSDATLAINMGVDVTHIAYCLTVPQGATNVATTTINGNKFLSYTVGAGTTANVGTTYYRILHESSVNTCYDIQKNSQGSVALNTKLNAILATFTFKNF